MKTVFQTNSATLVFTPGAAGVGTLNFSQLTDYKDFAINRLMAVINQTRNVILYAEANTGYTDYNHNTRVMTLNVDTSSHAATDSIQVIYDADAAMVTYQEELMDPVNKSRMSEPQSLIDTDFEYGLQPTKWEFANTLNNKPTCFIDPANPLNPNNYSSIQGNNTRVVTINFTAGNPHGLSVGDPIFIQDALDISANGWYLVESVPTTTQLTYTAKGNVATGNQINVGVTLIFRAYFYTGAGIPLDTSAFSSATNIITCRTRFAHGLSRGDLIYVIGTAGPTAATSINGSHIIETTPNAQEFTFVSYNGTPSTAITNTAGIVNLFGRPGGYSIHRAFDGGVAFSCGGGAPGLAMARQTRKYFRYQAGKGMQFSTGTCFKPSFQVSTVEAQSFIANPIVTVTCRFPHGMQPGSQIVVYNSTDNAFNGTYEIQTVPNELSFTYTCNGTPTALQAPGYPIFISPGRNWGSTVRVGMFDSQNGIFFEHDGADTYVVRRHSVYQLTGYFNVNLGSNVVTGTGTLFSQQLNPGDFIVIKGMSYRVLSITSNTQLFISPEYRGAANAVNATASRTIDVKIPQSQWNIDKMDGTGPSGYTMDATKMQMLYIDFSWYGAGFIRWGMRSQNGDVKFCHKMKNNNIHHEAYMRSGNLPARYEENSIGPTTIMTQTVLDTDSRIYVSNVTEFPDKGIIRVTQPGNTNTSLIEYMRYNQRVTAGNYFDGLTRAQQGGHNTPVTFTHSQTAPTQVELMGMIGPTASSNVPSAHALSHWGSSVIMDGRYDDDFNFVFTAPAANTIIEQSGTAIEFVALALRLAPSVDNGRTGLLGVREIINRMQVKLRTVDILASGIYRVNIYLNSVLDAGSTALNFVPVGGSSLCQMGVPTTGGVRLRAGTGESIFGFLTPGNAQSFGSGTAQYAVVTQDLSLIRELGNAVLGGGNTLEVPRGLTQSNVYPDGPDILYITLQRLAGSPFVGARISWTESQA